MPTKIIVLLSSTVLLLCTGCTSQKDRRPPPGVEQARPAASHAGIVARPIGLLFATMDTDRNTYVDAAELADGIALEWERLSGGGKVGALDFEPWSMAVFGSSNTLPSFIVFDRDLNGVLTPAEFEDRLRDEFGQLDKDGNGMLDRSELVFRIAGRTGEAGGYQQGGGRRGGGDRGQRPPR